MCPFTLYSPPFCITSQIAPDNLKRGNVVRFSDEGTKSSVNNLAMCSSKTCGNSNNLATSPCGKACVNSSGNAALTLNDYMKESKTLNVNVLAEEDEEMNNEIRYGHN
jgi:hypothetical protein